MANRFRKTEAQRKLAARNAGKQRIKPEPFVEVIDGVEFEYETNPYVKNYHNPNRNRG